MCSSLVKKSQSLIYEIKSNIMYLTNELHIFISAVVLLK